MLHPELDKMILSVFSNNGGWTLSLPNNETIPTVLFNQSNSQHDGTHLVNRLAEQLAYEFRLFSGKYHLKTVKIPGISIRNNVENPTKLFLVGLVCSPLSNLGRAMLNESFLLAHAIVLLTDTEEYFYRPTTQAKVADDKVIGVSKWYYGRNLYGTKDTLTQFNSQGLNVFDLDNKSTPIDKTTLSQPTPISSNYNRDAEQQSVDALQRQERKQLEILNFFTDVLKGKIDIDSLNAQELTEFIDMNRKLFDIALARVEKEQI